MRRLSVKLPFDGSLVGETPVTELHELPDIFARAERGAKIMREMTRAQRSSLLRRTSELFLVKKETLASIVAQESGKPIREARAEVERAALTLAFSAEEANRLAGEEVPMDAAPAGRGRMALTIRQPLGLVAAITPFNFPLNLSMHKIGPALAAGNAVLHKPASATPLCAIEARELFLRCGLPEEALQVLAGPGGELGAALVQAPEIKMLTFTGSAQVGLALRAQAGLKRLTLELGNNSAVVVRADADLGLAAAACVAGAFAHSGQTCISVQRIFVEASARDEFTQRFTLLASQLKRGHPLTEETDLSSLIEEKEAERVEAWIAEARAAGAQQILGGERHGAQMPPAALLDVPLESRLMRQEAFGPVAAINAFHSLEEAIALVNDSTYGLQTGIFTRDLSSAFRFAREVESGGVLINDVSNFRVDQMPYGGVKESGIGREGPRYAIEEMSESKLISWRL